MAVFRQFLYRWSAFSCFVCAAFAWVPPLIDRAGLAALGLGFLALSLGRAWGVARSGIPLATPDPLGALVADLNGQSATVTERIGAYSDDA